MKSLLAMGLAMLASAAQVSLATTPECEGSPFILQGKYLDMMKSAVAQSPIAFQGEVVAVDPPIPSATTPLPSVMQWSKFAVDQNSAFRVLHPWKGSYRVGEVVNLTVGVAEVCGGIPCIPPFRIGGVTLLLSLKSLPSYSAGCWVYEGVAINGVLSVPTALTSGSRR